MAEAVKKGPIWCDNRSAVISGRKGWENTAEIPKRSRHVALRFGAVLQESSRIWFAPTDWQKADGLTKSVNRAALDHLVENNPKPHYDEAQDEECEDLDMTDCFWALFGSEAKPKKEIDVWFASVLDA